MARGAKKEIMLTPEEKLAQALVPEAEQPYRVPENWRWTKVGNLSSLHRGVSYKKNDAHLIRQDNDCLVMRGGNVGEGYIDVNVDNVYVDISLVSEEQLIKANDIVIVASTGSTKVIGRAGISFASYTDVAFGAFLMVVRPDKNIVSRYMDYYFQCDLYRNRIRDLASGVNINNIRSEYISESPFPLPPLAEQQRIVDRIESLFAKLDEAKEKAQAVVDGFEDRKAAILHKAFTGELSAGWRKAHSDCESNWKNSKIGNLTDIVSSKRIYKEEYAKEGVPFFRSSEVVELYDTGYTEPTFFISRDRYEEIKSTYGVPEKGDLLVTSVGTIGKTWIVDDREFYYKDGNLTQVKKSSSLDMRYLQFFIMSNEFKMQVSNTVAGTAYNALTIVKFKNISLLLPSVDEQLEIVRILENLFAKEKHTKEAAEQVIDQIDTMKKAILARAFRGELGTNDPVEESAEKMLNAVL